MPDEIESTPQTTRPIGRYRGTTVHLSVRAHPSLAARAPESFAVTLFIASPEGTNVEIARIDTSDAGVHFDRLYLPLGHPNRKDYGVDIVDYRAAERLMLDRWEDLVKAFDSNHGWPASAVD